MKYIDADLLRKEIEVQRDLFMGHAAILKKTIATDGFDVVIKIIDSLQQEQPEVDLEKEVRKYCDSSFRFNYDEFNDSFYSNAFEFDDVVELARHFYELGLNARKEK